MSCSRCRGASTGKQSPRSAAASQTPSEKNPKPSTLSTIAPIPQPPHRSGTIRHVQQSTLTRTISATTPISTSNPFPPSHLCLASNHKPPLRDAMNPHRRPAQARSLGHNRPHLISGRQLLILSRLLTIPPSVSPRTTTNRPPRRSRGRNGNWPRSESYPRAGQVHQQIKATRLLSLMPRPLLLPHQPPK